MKTTNKSTNEWQKKLIALYSEFFKNDEIKNKLEEYDNYPFLLSIPDDFAERWNSNKRVMIIGEQTNGWCPEIDDNASDDEKIEALMKAYEEFYFTDEKWEYGRHFWNYFYAITELLKMKYNNNIEVLWNNYYKWQGVYDNDIAHLLKDMLINEIRILMPDLIIILKGGDVVYDIRDNVLKSQENIEEEYWKGNHFLFSYFPLSIQDKKIPIFNTYHPVSSKIKLKLFMDRMLEKLNKMNG